MPTDFIVDVDDVFIIFLFDLQTHTHIQGQPSVYWHAKGQDFGLISVWCLPRSDIIETSARVARLPWTGTSPTLHIS